MVEKYGFHNVEKLGEQPDATFEEIEQDIEKIREPESMLAIKEFIAGLPKKLQRVCKEYPIDQIYRIKKGAPYRFTCPGCIVALRSIHEHTPVEFSVLVLRSPIGYAGVVAEVEPKWLEHVTVDQLRSELN